MLPCPYTEEDIDSQEVEPATPMGRSVAPIELGLPPINPCNLEDGGELEFQTILTGTAFRQPANSETQIDRPTVPPQGCTLDPTQEFGGPDESRYPVNNESGNARYDRSQDSNSVSSQYESISAGSSTVDDDGNRTIHTSQHGGRR